ncbi:MAG: hypothetical protein JWO04_1480 [Gammaproteobacteria bacterium]|nr:hypothetical protein [Gammaproteobacteria bacterium]
MRELTDAEFEEQLRELDASIKRKEAREHRCLSFINEKYDHVHTRLERELIRELTLPLYEGTAGYEELAKLIDQRRKRRQSRRERQTCSQLIHQYVAEFDATEESRESTSG